MLEEGVSCSTENIGCFGSMTPDHRVLTVTLDFIPSDLLKPQLLNVTFMKDYLFWGYFFDRNGLLHETKFPSMIIFSAKKIK